MTNSSLYTAMLALAVLFTPTVNATVTPRTCPTGITKDMVINYNDYVSCGLEALGEIDFYRFQGSVGEKIEIVLSASNGWGPEFILYDPTQTLVSDVGSGGSPVTYATFTLAKTGMYTIRVFDSGFNDLFTYKLYLERYVPATSPQAAVYGQTRTESIDPAEEVDQWIFAGTAGDRIAIQVSASAGFGPAFDLWQPDGVKLNTTVTAMGAPIARAEFTLAQTGTHLIRVYDDGRNGTWTYTLFVQCLGTCSIGALKIPTINISLTGCTTCSNGNTFSAVLTVTTMPLGNTELKVGFYMPDSAQEPAIDPHIELPQGFAFDGEVLRGTIAPSHQRGSWLLCARVIGLGVGDTLAASCRPFTIQ